VRRRKVDRVFIVKKLLQCNTKKIVVMASGCSCGIVQDTLGERFSSGSAWYCGVCEKPIAVCEFFLKPDVHFAEINRLIVQDGVSRTDSVNLYHSGIGTVRKPWSEGETGFLWSNYITDTVQQSRDLIPFWMKFFSHRSPVDLIDRILITRMLVKVGLSKFSIVRNALCGKDLEHHRIYGTTFNSFLCENLSRFNYDIWGFLCLDDESYGECARISDSIDSSITHSPFPTE